MENDWDLQLSQEMDSNHNLIEQKQFEPDSLIQPITTQERFNVRQNYEQNLSPTKRHQQQRAKAKQYFQEDSKSTKVTKNNQDLVQQTKKFRQYLNQKVQELRKSKQQININEQSPVHSKAKTNTLRKIINREQMKQKSIQKLPGKSTMQKALPQQTNKTQNTVNKTTTTINKTVQPITSSAGSNKQQNSKKQEHQKRFSNSHSNLVKNIQKKQPGQKNSLNDIKKSLNFDPKSPKLPELTPPLKIPHPKNQPHSIHQRKDQRKNTIDTIHGKEVADRHNEKRKTPQSKNSFRIKRTSNVQQTTPAQHSMSIDVKKAKEVSMKVVQKESPLHQGKNKRMREEFMRLNEEQRAIQQQILRHHKETKKTLDSLMKKYQISSESFQKYGIKKQVEFSTKLIQQKITQSPQKKQSNESRIQKPSQKDIKNNQQVRTQSPLKNEKRKNQFLDEQLQKINNHLKTRQKQIKKCESRIQKNPYIQFLRQMPEDILEQPQEDEAQQDIVPQLPPQNRIDSKYDSKQFSSTYSSVMSEMKNKKWGLKQRITFETHRQTSDNISGKGQSRMSNNLGFNSKKLSSNQKNLLQSPTGQQQNADPYSKIEVNSRLRNLLLD